MGNANIISEKFRKTIKSPLLSTCVFFSISFGALLFPICAIKDYHIKNEQAILQTIQYSGWNERINQEVENNTRSLFIALVSLSFLMSLSMASFHYYVRKRANNDIRKTQEDVSNKQKELQILYDIEKEKSFIKDKQEEISFRLQVAHNNSQNLKNTISGVNHEVSPWLGIIRNVANMTLRYINIRGDALSLNDIKFLKNKVDEIEKSAEQCIGIVENLSKNVKYLQKYDMTDAKLGATISAMVSVALLNSTIRKNLRPSQIEVDYDSLDFNCPHSPMFLQQILLNLVNNAIDHNDHMKETLHIKISGMKKAKTLFVSDNGRGIPTDVMRNIFTPNFSTKDDTSVSHGLGLSMCMDYAVSMGAYIDVRSEVGKYTEFFIQFDIGDDEDEEGNKRAVGDTSHAYIAYKKRKEKTKEFDLGDTTSKFINKVKTDK